MKSFIPFDYILKWLKAFVLLLSVDTKALCSKSLLCTGGAINHFLLQSLTCCLLQLRIAVCCDEVTILCSYSGSDESTISFNPWTLYSKFVTCCCIQLVKQDVSLI